MNVDYESVAWFVELCYNFFQFSDGVMLWAALLPAAMLLLYSVLCVCLIPFSVLHHVIVDARRGSFSIGSVLTAVLFCYPTLLPWAWNCKGTRYWRRLLYYLMAYLIWYPSIGGLVRIWTNRFVGVHHICNSCECDDRILDNTSRLATSFRCQTKQERKFEAEIQDLLPSFHDDECLVGNSDIDVPWRLLGVSH